MLRRTLKTSLSLGVAAYALALGACSTAPKSAEGKDDIERDAAVAIDKAQESDSTLKPILDDAAGYAVFPKIGKGAIGVGGAYGKGVLYENGAVIGYCDLTQGTIGFQLGGQTYTEMIAFETDNDMDIFKRGNLNFDAQATAVALRSGAGANAEYTNGVAVFTMDEAGLMFEASIGGQQFSYQAK